MKTVHAIYEHGVFRPLEKVDLPEASQVEFEPRPTSSDQTLDQAEIYSLLDQRFHSGETNIAARHDEHQP